MPIAYPTVKPRWPVLPYPMINGTTPTTTAKPPPNNPEAKETLTPSTIPSPIYESVTVAPVERLPPSSTPPALPTYPGSGAILLQGHCTEPAYTILDGPTAVWIPVVGCVSSKADCCPTPNPTRNSGALSTAGANMDPSAAGTGGAGGGVQFPISFMPSQGMLTGCPEDYHTVGETACCPSSYWLWSTTLGGQVPCFSSLIHDLKPPPIPATLVDTEHRSKISMITKSALVPPTALTLDEKPTSAIVNIVYAMQYPLAPESESTLKKEAKIGIGVGASSAAVLIAIFLWFLARKRVAKKRSESVIEQNSVARRFGNNVDMSRVAHEPAGVERTRRGVKYSRVATRAVNF